MYFLQFEMFLFALPALLLGMLAQWMVQSRYATASQMPTRLNGYAAARRILDANHLYNVDIEEVPGKLSDHYDPRQKVLRLSPEVFHGRSLASVGIAAHEAGHALQDAKGYFPLVVRNMAVPLAGFGSNIGLMMAVVGIIFTIQPLLLAGIVLFSAVVFFQLVNLPVEFDASNRAKALLVSEGIVPPQDMNWVNKVLNAAALTYVAGTLQAVLQLIYLVMRYNGRD